MTEIKFRGKGRSASPSQTIVETRKFRIVIDEPKSAGGTNEAANPVEYLLAALAGCLNVVAHNVARERGIELRGVQISIEGDLDVQQYASDDRESAVYKEIRAIIQPDTDIPNELLTDWLEEVEERCAVSRTLKAAIPVVISLHDGHKPMRMN